MSDKELEMTQELPQFADTQDFSLEDIMKEFGDAEIPEEEEQLTIAGEPVKQEEVPVEEAAAMAGDTVRMPAIQGSQMAMGMGDTIRVELPHQEEAPEEEEFVPVMPPQEEETEPFSENWEPDYEQPIGEYVPPQPILFRPRSKAHELKRKLVAGPERRYYELSERGVGGLQLAMLICLAVVLLSAVVAGMDALHKVPEERLKLMVFSQLFAMAVCAVLGCYQMIDGVTDLIKGRFTLNTMLTVTFVVCCVDGIFCLTEQRIPCCAAFGLQMFMSLLRTYHLRTTQIGMTDVLRKANRLEALSRVEDFYEGEAGLLRGEGKVEDFMDHYENEAKPDKVLSLYALLALGASLLVGAVAGVLHLSVSFGVQVMSVSLLAAVPVTSFIAVSRPWAILTRRLHKLGSVICGWQGVGALSGKVAFPLTHEDLFPVGTCKLNGVKFYGSRNPDEVVAYCNALISADGGGLAPLFEHLLNSRNGRHYPAQTLRIYPGGIGGEVCDVSVLIGEPELLQEMGVEIPEGISVSQAVYAAIDGELCGVFAVSYGKDKSSAAGITTLSSYRGLRGVLTCGDFMITEEFLDSRFRVNTKRICFPERLMREALAQEKLPEDSVAAALITGEGLAPYAYAATGARTLHSASRVGMIIAMLGGALGITMMLVLAILGAKELLIPANMFLYELVWLIPGILLTEWTRSI